MSTEDKSKVKVTCELRDSPNLAKLARALIRLAQAEQEKEALAVKQSAQAESSPGIAGGEEAA